MNILQIEYFKYALKLHKSKQINEMTEKNKRNEYIQGTAISSSSYGIIMEPSMSSIKQIINASFDFKNEIEKQGLYRSYLPTVIQNH